MIIMKKFLKGALAFGTLISALGAYTAILVKVWS